jgi:putative N6-adenine-specific DNA methylase
VPSSSPHERVLASRSSPRDAQAASRSECAQTLRRAAGAAQARAAGEAGGGAAAQPSFELFAVSAPGLESLTAGELRAQGVDDTRVVPGGVAFAGDLERVYRANLELRTAGRILLRLGEVPARTFDDLGRRAARLPWELCVGADTALAFRTTSRKSRLYHTAAVEERLAAAARARVGGVEPSTPRRTQLVVVRLERDVCAISVDTSGDPLHKRGWREATGRAPLRETAAAGLLLASGWDMRSPLLDPFCGAGTIPLEAAELARGLPPGRARRFAFEGFASFDEALWDRVRARAPAGPDTVSPPRIVGTDRDAGVIAAARENAARAGLAESVALHVRALSALAARADQGWVVTDPPHGVRLRGGDLRDLYARLGQVLRERLPGWHVALLCGSPVLRAALALPLREVATLRSGGLRLLLLAGRVRA